MTRLQYFEVGGSAQSGGQQGGDTVFFGPEYGDNSAHGAGVAVALRSLDLGPFAAPRAGVAAAFRSLDLGPFPQPAAGVAAAWSALGLGPFAAPAAGVAVSAFVFVDDLRPGDDTWLDQANPNTTAGAATELFARQATVIGNQQRTAYVAWDLTGFSGKTVRASGSRSATFAVSRTDGLINANLNYDVYTHTSQPFVEGTATWNNSEPPPGTLLTSGQFANLGTTLELRTHTFTEANANTALGRWLYFRFTGENGLGNTTNFRVVSKENATAGNRPALDLTVNL